MNYALTIAGSDPTCGAGCEADIKTFASCGIHAFSVETTLTCQGKQGLQSASPVPEKLIEAQLALLLRDYPISVVKIGALSSVVQSEIIANILQGISSLSVVFDPVFAASNGHAFIDTQKIPELMTNLLPIATCITPNKSEAEVLWGKPISDVGDAQNACRAICQMKAKSVYLKGGHFLGSLRGTDILYCENKFHVLKPKINFNRANELHGTGCALSTLIASYLFHGESLHGACLKAKKRLHDLILNAQKKQYNTQFLWPFGENGLEK